MKEIRQLTSPDNWRFCPGTDNPADLASRGTPATALIESNLWWNGPPWLQEDEERWPIVDRIAKDEGFVTQVNGKARKTITAAATVKNSPTIEWNLERISNFDRLVRITAWKLRFKNRQPNSPRAAMTLIKIEGNEYDEDVNVPFLFCVPCQRLQSRPFNEEPAPLPLSRTREAAPFEVTGVDFAGPLFVKPHTGSSGTENQGKQELEKMYICLFTCEVTRAVHLELVRDMTAHTFILALKRFFARRGISSIIYSDNAQTFHYTEKYLKSIQTDPTVNDWLANNRVEWRFSPDLSPWWGGFWERMVRSVKDLLRKSIGKKTMNFDQFQTELTEIEAVINDRPLTYVAEGVDEPYPLSPSLLLMGRRANTTPSKPAVTINKESSNQRALIDQSKQRSTLVHEWFKLWQKDYLNDLSDSTRKGKPDENHNLENWS